MSKNYKRYKTIIKMIKETREHVKKCVICEVLHAQDKVDTCPEFKKYLEEKYGHVQ